MAGLTPMLVATFLALTALQLGGLALLPRTQGFTNIPAAVGMVALFTLSYWMMARMIQNGTNLGLIVPLMSVIIPLCTVGIGIFMYGESASAVRIALLASACVLVGLASRY